MAAKVIHMSTQELERMATGSLLARLRLLLACEEFADMSDEIGSPRDPGIIRFKSDPDWNSAHSEVKRVLAGREHLPTAAERAQKRLRRAADNKTKERRR
jgi:hypothetical protein